MKASLSEEIVSQHSRGVLLILTGPSGAGKDVVLDKILSHRPNTIKIITTTSRLPRPNETDGHPYHFVTREAFETMIGTGEFFEWVEFRGEFYGTTKKTLNDALASGHDVVWRIDVKGVKNIKDKVKKMTERAVFVFLTAPSMKILEQRVQNAPGDTSMRWNPSIVSWEMSQFDDCEYLVVNEENSLDKTVDSIVAIMDAKRHEIHI